MSTETSIASNAWAESCIARLKTSPTRWLYYFNVAAIKATVKRVIEKGGRVHGSPQRVPSGDWVVIADDSCPDWAKSVPSFPPINPDPRIPIRMANA